MFKLDANLIIHDGPIYASTVLGNHLYTGGADNLIKRFDLKSMKLDAFTVRATSAPISMVKIDENRLAVGFLNGEIYILDINNRSILFSYHFQSDGVFSLSVKLSTLYLGLASGKFGVLCSDSYEWIFLNEIARDKIRCILPLEKNSICLASKDGSIIHVDSDTFQVIQRWNAHDEGVNTLLCLGEKGLVSGGKDGHIAVWDNSFNLIKRFPAHRGVVYDMLAINNCLISCSRDKIVKVWDLNNYEPIQKLMLHRQSVNKIAQQNENSFVTASDDHQIAIWSHEV